MHNIREGVFSQIATNRSSLKSPFATKLLLLNFSSPSFPETAGVPDFYFTPNALDCFSADGKAESGTFVPCGGKRGKYDLFSCCDIPGPLSEIISRCKFHFRLDIHCEIGLSAFAGSKRKINFRVFKFCKLPDPFAQSLLDA